MKYSLATSIKVLVSLSALAFSCNGQAAVHSETTAFEDLKTQLQIQPGQTYLAFMRNQVKPALDAFEDDIDAEAQKFPSRYSQWQTDLIAKGDGVAIRIDSANYFFNVGYLDGSDRNDIKSGRSYGIGPTGRESDPSDAFYLSELEQYLQSEPNQVGALAQAIMLVLTDCDTSGWAALSQQGQIVATDFLAIYTAELDRHLMVGLAPKSHPWEIDLAAATFVSVFNAATGLMPSSEGTDLSLTTGSISQWWAKGQQGSGIGETRSVRMVLTARIGAFEKRRHSELISPIVEVVGSNADGDVIQNVFAFLNAPSAPENFSDRVIAHKLTKAFAAYVEQVQKDASTIATEGIQAN